MKKLLLVFLSLLISITLVACGGDSSSGDNGGSGNSESNLTEITGIEFESAEFTYDATPKSIAISGTLPDGVSVSYSKNGITDAGAHSITATLSGDGYATKTLTATLTINKANITGISAEASQSVKDDGEAHLPTFSGTIPSGVSVKYLINDNETDGIDKVGTHDVKIVFSGKNYNELVINVSFEIKLSLSGLADRAIEAFGSVPDIWGFLPDSFSPEYRAISKIPDYSNFVNVSGIPTNGMGKQLNVVYGLLTKAETALSYVNTVYGALNTVKSLYTSYLDTSPENYKSFSANAGAFTFALELGEEEYTLAASVGTVAVTIYANLTNESYGAIIKLASNTSLKYTVMNNELIVAMDILDSASLLVNFVRDEQDKVTGAVYEYLTVADKTVTATSALIDVCEDYTVIIGTKGDFIPTSDARNCEVYNNANGQLIGSEVRETIKDVEYNTYWFPLVKLSGVNTIKKVDKMNGTNADTIYINGSSDTLHTTLVGLSNLDKATSRRYDIEFKTMYFFVQNTDGEYEQVTAEIPMLFIQAENIDTFESDFAKSNKTALNSKSVTLTVTSSQIQAINYGYTVALPVYDKLKNAVTHNDIINYCKK